VGCSDGNASGQFLILDAESTLQSMTLRTDPVRIIEAIVTGIAFLGAGTIFRDPDYHGARGLTTAASLLIVAPIGIAVALERYILAVGVTVLALFVLRVVRRFEKHKAGFEEHPSSKAEE
jgi:putative Mg2+ transporter-C (MgtC) family protein